MKHLSAIAASALLSVFFSATAFAGTTPGRVEFEVLRGGQPFGRQSVTVSERNGSLIAETSATLHAGLGPITLFHYTQRCTETWREGALSDLDCVTRRNGRTTSVAGARAGDALRMRGTAGVQRFVAATLPTSWWTRPPLATRLMINTENGARLQVHVSFIGRETIVANGRRIGADHIRVEGTLPVDLWYDDAGHWVGCAFSTQGQHMTYRLLTTPAQGPS